VFACTCVSTFVCACVCVLLRGIKMAGWGGIIVTYTQICKHIHAHTSYTHMHMNTPACTHTHTHTHTRTQTHTHTHTHIRIHIQDKHKRNEMHEKDEQTKRENLEGRLLVAMEGRGAIYNQFGCV
jgi:L-alanine-DL-glutamate epimerase-like enolase superfamily enzyme